MIYKFVTLLLLPICIGDIIPDQYIIKLKPSINSQQYISSQSIKGNHGILSPLSNSVIHVYNGAAFNGFAAKLDSEQLKAIKASKEVLYVEEDQTIGIDDFTPYHYLTQTNAPWGLGRISTRSRLSGDSNGDFSYSYLHESGAGITVYVIDTGVYTQHNDFGGRAVFGANFIEGESGEDLNGHGTHVAATVAGTLYGVAKNALIVSVKVLPGSGSGTTSGVIGGIEWSVTNASSKSLPSVINMSLGGSASQTLDDAVNQAVQNNVTVVVAAGNNNNDSCMLSPARAELAITVAASDFNDSSASFTSYGKCVDIYAPGLGIASAWIGSPTANRTISGTSMASPHVAGVAAYLIVDYKLNTPRDIANLLQAYATNDTLTNVPNETPNALLFNGHETSGAYLKLDMTAIVLLVVSSLFFNLFVYNK